MLVAVTAGAALALGIGLWAALPVASSQDYVTAVGEQREVLLEDGSRVLLNTGTRLHVRLSRDTREIELAQGEAIFRVHHDASRPFYVKAGGSTTRAIGTQFNVMYLDRQVEVTVLEGRVSVSATGPSQAPQLATLDVGQSTVFREATGLAPVGMADLGRIAAWQKRRVEFDNVPLQQAVNDFNRYSDTQVVLGDAALGRIRISGGFRCGDVEDFADALTHTFGIRALRDAGRIVLLPAS
jgi:transmembrane sensor